MKRRHTTGIVLIVAAPIALVMGAGLRYGNQVACTNPQVAQIMGDGHCDTAPPTGAWIVAGVLVIVGILTLAPWWLRWIAGVKPPPET